MNGSSVKPFNRLYSSVSEMEGQILDGLSDGMTKLELSDIHHTSQKTIETHLNRAMHKLGAATSYEAVKFWALGRAPLIDPSVALIAKDIIEQANHLALQMVDKVQKPKTGTSSQPANR